MMLLFEEEVVLGALSVVPPISHYVVNIGDIKKTDQTKN
jgi:hypothetical protein